jgi:hypothetical protein
VSLFSPNVPASEMNALFGDTRYILHQSNRGYSFMLAKNSSYSKTFEDIGIKPQFMFFCAFHFLFRPKKSVLELAHPYSSQLMDKDTLKIGIHIRGGIVRYTVSILRLNCWLLDVILMVPNHYCFFVIFVICMKGDKTFWGKIWKKPDMMHAINLTSDQSYQKHFDCATKIENEYFAERGINDTSKRKVVWYLISDSLQVRLEAKEKYGDKLLTNTQDEAIHTGG